jgi:uncharacterized protein YqeY
MLRDTLQNDLNTSLKKGKADRVETIRFLLAAVRNTAIDKYGAAGEAKMTDEDILTVIQKQIKTHRESIDAFGKAGRMDLVDHEKVQLDVLCEYAPKELTDEELTDIILPILSDGEKNFGILMKKAMIVVAGKAEGGRVAAVLKELLSSK